MVVREAIRSDLKAGNHFFYRPSIGDNTLLPTVVIMGFIPYAVDESDKETCVCVVKVIKMFHPENDKKYLGEIFLASQDQLLVTDEFIG